MGFSYKNSYLLHHLYKPKQLQSSFIYMDLGSECDTLLECDTRIQAEVAESRNEGGRAEPCAKSLGGSSPGTVLWVALYILAKISFLSVHFLLL